MSILPCQVCLYYDWSHNINIVQLGHRQQGWLGCSLLNEAVFISSLWGWGCLCLFFQVVFIFEIVFFFRIAKQNLVWNAWTGGGDKWKTRTELQIMVKLGNLIPRNILSCGKFLWHWDIILSKKIIIKNCFGTNNIFWKKEFCKKILWNFFPRKKFNKKFCQQTKFC